MPQDGGGYVQGLNYFKQFSNELSHSNLDLFVLSNNEKFCNDVDMNGVKKLKFQNFKLRKKIMLLLLNLLPIQTAHIISKFFCISFEGLLRKKKLDLIIFLGPSSLVSMIGGTNFITCCWDLSHREDLEFPEVRDPYIFFQREFWITNYYKFAYKVICDSLEGKRMLQEIYRLDPSRLLVVPFSPNSKLNYASGKDRIRRFGNFDLKNEKYIFYPAQFWPHKSHMVLIEALDKLITRNIDIKLILTGGDKGNKNLIENKVIELGLTEAVIFAGFVDDLTLESFYYYCNVVAMPSWFGPTNLPPLEGLKFGKPVILPNKKSFKDFYGDSCFYFEWPDENSLADLISVSIEKRPKNEIVTNFYEGINEIENGTVLKKAIEDYLKISRLW